MLFRSSNKLVFYFAQLVTSFHYDTTSLKWIIKQAKKLNVQIIMVSFSLGHFVLRKDNKAVLKSGDNDVITPKLTCLDFKLLLKSPQSSCQACPGGHILLMKWIFKS